ncbi:MAG: uracil-DNA glycosylase [Christensenellales bacterium]
MREAWIELKTRAEAAIRETLGGTPVFGEGNLQADVVLVGEAPGQEETLQKRPFVGRAGKNLDEFLALSGLQREKLYISNVVKVRPTKTGKSGRVSNRPPSRSEIQACCPFLWEEIRLIAPKIVVTLGNVALKALCGEGKTIGLVHGTLVESTWPVFPLYHPASIIYNRALISVYRQDIKALALLFERDNAFVLEKLI